MIAEKAGEFLAGKVVFTASGGFPSLFLEECSVRKTVLRDVEQGSGRVTAWTGERDYREVVPAAEKAGMTLVVQEVSGLPKLLRRCRARAGLLTGVLLGALLVWYLSGSIWEVTVSGNEKLGAEEILDALEEQGVGSGARISRTDAGAVERQLQARLPQLSWIAVNITGCKAAVEVREVTEPPALTPEGEYSNIVAERDGVILRADVLSGEGQPKIGEAVVKGDLLVSGVVEMRNGRYRLTEAKAVIEALTKTELSVSAENSFAAQTPVERRETYAVRFFGLRIPLGIAPREGETETSCRFLRSRRTVLPVGVSLERTAVFSEQAVTLDEKRTKLLCFASFCEQASDRYREAAVLRRSIGFSPGKDSFSLLAQYECVEDIARRIPLPVQPPDR